MKAFTIYKIVNPDIRLDERLMTEYENQEPTGSQWATIGFKPYPSLYVDQIKEGMIASREMMGEQSLLVSIIERVLPKEAIKRHTNKLVAAYQTKINERPSINLIKQWEEVYIDTTLPNCPLKETVVEVSFDYEEGFMLIGTSNTKLADTILSFLMINALPASNGAIFEIYKPEGLDLWLKSQLLNNGLSHGTAKLINAETGAKVSISKDDDCELAHDIINQLGSFVCTEVGLYIEDVCGFVLTEKGIVKSIDYIVKKDEEQELAHTETAAQRYLAQHLIELTAKRKILEVIKNAKAGIPSITC